MHRHRKIEGVKQQFFLQELEIHMQLCQIALRNCEYTVFNKHSPYKNDVCLCSVLESIKVYVQAHVPLWNRLS